jgi:hypothetical protein
VTTRRDSWLGSALVGVMAATALLGAAQTATDPSAVLGQARQALGGEAKLSAVKTFVATGRTRQVRGETLVPIEFEIAVELPDKYVRRDEIPAQESGPTSTGFNGDGLIQVPAPPPAPPMPAAPAAAGPGPAGRAGGRGPMSPEAARLARLNGLKQDFAKLTLGMFAASFPGYPMTFTVAGRAESPQGTADVLDAKGPADPPLRLFISTTTHLPLMVSWTTPATMANIVVTVPGGPKPTNLPAGAILVEGPAVPGAAATADERAAFAKAVQDLRAATLASAKPIANYVYYSDYRDAGGGVQFPFRLRKAVGADTTEQTDFDGFKLNARIDPKKFEVVK